jgi:ArsR family transcriptional regulator
LAGNAEKSRRVIFHLINSIILVISKYERSQPHPRCPAPTIEEAAQAFAAIGSEPRLQALRLLVRAGPDGLNVGEVQQALGLAASTCTHHLRFLAAAGLVTQVKKGRSIACSANFERIEALAEYLVIECCVDASIPMETAQ